jgi:TonB-linked SusC/RagA family outer membrane protein
MDGILDQKTQPFTGTSVSDQELSTGYWHFTLMNIPTFSVYANDTPPYFTDFGYPYHPIAETTSDIGGYKNIEQKTFQSNLSLDYNVKGIDGLSLKGMFGYFNQISTNKTWRKKYSVYTYDAANDVIKETGIQNAPSKLSVQYGNYWQTTALAQANYEKTFLEHSTFKANLSYERRHQKFDNISVSKEFEIDIDQFFAGSSDNQLVNSSGLYENDNQNLIGRINYNYSDRYLLQAGFNYGGSSKFPKGKRWGFFPYASAAWRISEEGFFKNHVSFIDQLKLRGSWGQTGDDSAAAYQYLTGYTYPSGNYMFDGTLVSGLGFKGAANPNITWFTSTMKNLGVDLTVLNNSLSVNLDVFRRDRNGLLATRNLLIPVSVGATLPQENLNSDMDRGFEIGAAYNNSLGDFRYNVMLNLTYTRSYDNHIERAPSGNSYLNWRNNNEGRVKNKVFGYDYIGQFQSEAEILNSPIQDGQGNRTLSPGDLKYRDVNQDGIIDDMDVVPIGGNATPEYNYSLNLELSWKKFFMTIFFQGAAKYNFQYRGYAFYANRWGRNSLEVFMDRWHHEDIYDPSSPLIPGYYPQTGAINNVPSNHWNSSFWYPSATYLRLKELKVGYTLNNRFIKKIGIQSVDVFVSGWNLLTWHGMKANIKDPESVDNYGFDGNNAYPITTNYYLGLDITF